MTESVEHSLRLKDGRILAYHTFPKAEETKQESLHPVLYFHGMPGCGLEAGISCAHSIAREGGRVYAVDRPGMGRTSSPYNSKDSDDNESKSIADKNLETFIDSVWNLVEDQGWNEFSIIGVSGGGPYALAFLASYLQRRQKKKVDGPARLRNVCLVGAACFSAGTDGMKQNLVQISTAVEKAQSSRWYQFRLGSMALSMGPMYNYLLPALPLSWIMYLISQGNQDSAPADREWTSDENNIRPFLLMTQSMVAQGGWGAYDDIMIAFRAGHPHEEFLRKYYGGGETDTDDLPELGIFQGGSDTNVPPSHAIYLHESIFHKRSRLFEFEDLGHESMVMGKSDEYAAFATAMRKL